MIKKRIEIIPSLISMDITCMKESLKKIPSNVSMLHLDVMDGHYVENITFGPLFLRNIRKITKKKIDVHLMISYPEKYYSDFINAGADLISFHPETALNPLNLIKKIKEKNVKVGLALNPDISGQTIKKYLKHIDYVLIMSVFPGFSGQKFIESVLEKIDYFKCMQKKHNFRIEIDGGINSRTGRIAIQRGSEWIVTGSYLFKGKNVKSNIERILHGE